MTQTAIKYARVLWELHMPVEKVEEAAKLLANEPQLLEALSAPEVYIEKKYAVITRVFGKEICNFLKVLCKESDIESIEEIALAYREYVDTHKQIVKATLSYVSEPTKEQLEQMKDFLKREYQAQEAEVVLKKDEALIGGFVLIAEGQEYDWSLRGRLQCLEKELIGR